MKPLMLGAFLVLSSGGAALAQHDHSGHAPAAPADPHAGHGPTQAPADPHAAHAMHGLPASAPEASGVPQPPRDHAADAFFPSEEMARARAQLRREHGGASAWSVRLDRGEARLGGEGDAYAWNGEAWIGGDIHRLALKTEGEGAFDGDLREAEVQALLSRAVSPYFDLQLGVRQDFQPRPRRTWLAAGVEGVAPYWFDVSAAVFLSDRGEVTARLEGDYDLRITQRLVLQPAAEVNWAAEDAPDLQRGAGVTDAELGLRLRYHLARELAPYVGVVHTRRFGETADLARRAGEARHDTAVAVGVRAWF
ncbi:copper resistance protein B [Phenylobacterium sp.]|uniref:copper resistance protein B n=1 Tax=Phenylobacterium sp. TaxID=1871053 RepID=UPI00391B9D74